MTVDVKKVVGGLILLVVVAFFVIKIMSSGIFSTDADVSRMVEGALNTCPEDIQISKISNHMGWYISDDVQEGVGEPILAISEFETYLVCKAKGGVFSAADISTYEPGILGCAAAAYVAYINQLKAKESALAPGAGGVDEDDSEYTETVETREAYEKKYELFMKVFKNRDILPICNPSATSEQSAV